MTTGSELFEIAPDFCYIEPTMSNGFSEEYSINDKIAEAQGGHGVRSPTDGLWPGLCSLDKPGAIDTTKAHKLLI